MLAPMRGGVVARGQVSMGVGAECREPPVALTLLGPDAIKFPFILVFETTPRKVPLNRVGLWTYCARF